MGLIWLDSVSVSSMDSVGSKHLSSVALAGSFKGVNKRIVSAAPPIEVGSEVDEVEGSLGLTRADSAAGRFLKLALVVSLSASRFLSKLEFSG